MSLEPPKVSLEPSLEPREVGSIFYKWYFDLINLEDKFILFDSMQV